MAEVVPIVDKELIIVKSTALTKQEIIQELVERLEKNGYLSDVEQFITDIYLREEEGITGIGDGVAIPHGKSKGVKKTTIAVATLAQPVQWESFDEEVVDLVILFAVRDNLTDVNTKHILLLQQVAIMLANKTFITSIKQSDSVDEVYQILSQNIH